MNKIYTNNFLKINLYKRASSKSEIITQMIYGESFTVIFKKNNWWKIKIKEDDYVGFIKKKKFIDYLKPTHKVNILSAKIYKLSNKKKELGKLTFGSKIKVIKKQKKMSRFQNKWVKSSDLKPIGFKNKNIFSKIHMFKNVKYKWGGKTFEGIDCSALVQVFFNFNNRYCPRDTKDQFKFFKKRTDLNNLKKDDIIFWEGHVAIILSKKNLIHAYGPKKKTVVMNINKTIRLIKKTAKLGVSGIKKI
jgi:cell wall-associated NlpC family hydrolase|tara:strand:+ start:1219 stop:1959 length:741 start_codon:yes stop_codon:yes gene_type:complete